jgi:hypothetical protein
VNFAKDKSNLPLQGNLEANGCGNENGGTKKVEFLNTREEESTFPGIVGNVEDEGD